MRLEMDEEWVLSTTLREVPLLHLLSQSIYIWHGHICRWFSFDRSFKNNGFLATESTEKEIVSLVRVTEKKREFLKGEREKAKKKKKREDLKASEEREKSNKRLKEEKEPKIEDTNKDESASRGIPTKAISTFFFQHMMSFNVH